MLRSLLLLIALLCLHAESLEAQNHKSRDDIVVYHAYGNTHHLIVQGRMLKKRSYKSADKEDGWMRNLRRKIKQIKTDEIKHTPITLSIHHERFTVKGDDEGYFAFNAHTKQRFNMGYQKIALHIRGYHNLHTAYATIIDAAPLTGIISDFDDTIIISNVTDKIQLSINTLLKNYKQRVIVPTILKRFRKILAQNPKGAPSTLFVLSGSPLQLFTPIEHFLNYHHFPKHTLILKKIHGDNTDNLTDQFSYKTQKIEQLIHLYPTMRWILFGDNGEEDARIYAFIKNKYPSKVKNYYIRDVESGKIKKYK